MFAKNLSFVFVVALIASVLVLTGCARKPKIDMSGVQMNPATAENAGKTGGAGGDGEFIAGPEQTIAPELDNSPFGEAGKDGKGGAWGSTDKPVAGTDAGANLKNVQRWSDSVVYFGYDASDVPASERGKLDNLAKYLNENPNTAVIIEGHTDDRGSDEYNRALGERRTLSVKGYLALMGVADDRMQTISYGEDKPAVQGAAVESDHALNRRAEFLVGERL